MIDRPRSLCFKLRLATIQVALGLVSLMVHQVTIMNVALLRHTRMLKTDCFGETRLVLHAPSSS